MNKTTLFIITMLFIVTLMTTSCGTKTRDHRANVQELATQSTPIYSNMIPERINTFELDFRAISEGDALSELYFSGGGGGQQGSCLYSIGQYTKPTIISDFSSLTQRTHAPKLILDDLCICGLSVEQPVYLSLISSEDQILLTEEGESHYRNGDCYDTHVSTIEILPWEPLGTYIVTVSQSEHHLYYKFDVVSSDKPLFYYSPRLDAHIAMGFEPFKEVEVIQLNGNLKDLRISQAAKSTLNDMGQGVLLNNPSEGQWSVNGIVSHDQNGFIYIGKTNNLAWLISDGSQ